MRIKLSAYELMTAAQVGVMRHVSSLKKNLKDKHGCSTENGWQVHIEGACGELAFAKFTGMYYDFGVDKFKVPDVGEIQIRTRSKDWYDLIVRDDDSKDDVFCLVTGNAPYYTIRGWIRGFEAKQDKYKQTYGGREQAFFVPASELKSMDRICLA